MRRSHQDAQTVLSPERAMFVVLSGDSSRVVSCEAIVAPSIDGVATSASSGSRPRGGRRLRVQCRPTTYRGWSRWPRDPPRGRLARRSPFLRSGPRKKSEHPLGDSRPKRRIVGRVDSRTRERCPFPVEGTPRRGGLSASKGLRCPSEAGGSDPGVTSLPRKSYGLGTATGGRHHESRHHARSATGLVRGARGRSGSPGSPQSEARRAGA
jgi:hypothetical protein